MSAAPPSAPSTSSAPPPSSTENASASVGNPSKKSKSTSNTLETVLNALDVENVDSNKFSGAILSLKRPLAIGSIKFVDPEDSSQVVKAPDSYETQLEDERILHLNIWTRLLEAAWKDTPLCTQGISLSGLFFHTAPALGDYLVQGGTCPIDQYVQIADVANNALNKKRMREEE